MRNQSAISEGKIESRKRRGDIGLSSEILLKAVGESEKEYLAFGDDLHAFHDKATEVSSTSSSLVGLTLSGRLKELAKGLEGASEKMNDLGAGSTQGTTALESILEKACRIEDSLRPFQNVVRTLQVLCNLIGVESVRLGTEKGGFDALSDDVRNLARTIHEKSASITEKASALTMLVSENLARIQGFEKGQQDRGRLIAETIRTHLRALTERDEGASLRLRNIETTSEEIAKSIGEIVSSLQFHDITRQRIEHVTKALDRIHDASGRSGNGNGSGFGTTRFLGGILKAFHSASTEDLEERYQTYRLQKAQLLHTREELSSATDKIGASLRSLAGRIGDVSREARGVTQDARGNGTSIFTLMEEAVLGLTAAIHEYDAINTEIAAGVEGFTRAVNEMDGFLRDIVKIGIEMKMVALNAAIHAAHVGEWGLALGVLADHIHRLSQDTSGQIDSIGEDLRSIFDHASGLKSFASSVSSEKAEERTRAVEELMRIIPSLKELNARAIPLLERIEQGGNALSTEIEDRAGRVHFHERILQGIDALTAEIDQECRRIESVLMKKHGRKEKSNKGEEIGELARRYTMQRERDVHESIMGAAGMKENPAPVPVLGHVESKVKQESLGTNVELF